MYTLNISQDQTVAYISPCKRNGILHEELKPLGVLFEKPSEPDMATIPLSSRNAQMLRKIFTGRNLVIAPEHGRLLANMADSQHREAYEVFPSVFPQRVILNAQDMNLRKFSAVRSVLNQVEHHEVVPNIFMMNKESLKILSEKCPFIAIAPNLALHDPFAGMNLPEDDSVNANGRSIPSQKPQEAREVKQMANRGNSSSVAVPSPQSLPQRISLPSLSSFTGFDGTLASLRWVPLEAYEHIRKDSEKTAKANRSITEHNKKATTAKQKKKLNRTLAQKLSSMGINNAFDILHVFPLRYIDRSQPKIVRQLTEGEESAVLGIVESVEANYQKRYVKIRFKDMVGSMFSSLFMNQMYLQHMYKRGDEVIVNGKFGLFRGSPTINNAKIDKLGGARAIPMIPVYPQSGKNEVTTWDMRNLIEETLGRFGARKLEEPFSQEVMDKYQIPDRNTAYLNIHFPLNNQEFLDANRRLVYEEMFRLQVMIQRQRQDVTRSRGIVQNTKNTPTVDYWLNSLPYDLTGAQKRAISEIKENMASDTPMYRMIQGDVGAGKTSVCLWTVLNSLDNGFQSAVLAPTEILAEQLFNGLNEPIQGLVNPLTGLPLRIEFLAGKTRVAKAREIRAGLLDGSIDIVVGTHAILTEDTKFKNLGTVVIDEQHRFGVEQRSVLRKEREDGRTPDMLLMTATPIPRSSSMVLYGDLDLTILDELPPGRTPIETIWERVDAKDAVNNMNLSPWQDIRSEVHKGHQAYVVASLVEDNEKLAVQSVMDAYEKLSTQIFPEFKVGFVHGKQKREEREEIMGAFSRNEINILVATTVIEVGVNVPNSTVMVVLDPGRFGIAQLHQIRGRVGRSNLPSRCWLVGDTNTDEGEFRLNALVESTDGFYLSEKDLELRGSGTLFSTKQSGESDLYLAKIKDHLHILEIARDDVRELLTNDPKLQTITGRIFESEMEDIFGDKEIKS